MAPQKIDPAELEKTTEGVKEGQIAEEPVVLADLGQGEGAGESFEDDVPLREANALRAAGGARGVHHGGQIVDRDRRPPLAEGFRRNLGRASEDLIEAEDIAEPLEAAPSKATT